MPAPSRPMFRSPKILLLVYGLAALARPAAATTDILVVTDRFHPMQLVSGAKVIELDLPARIKAELSANLPAHAADAAALVQRRLHDGGPALQRRLTSAYQNVADAKTLGVTKIPAVIVDHRYVIYGETDVARAVARIKAYRGEQS